MGEIGNRLAEAERAIDSATRNRDIARQRLGDALAFGTAEEISRLETAVAEYDLEIDRCQLALRSLSLAVLREQLEALEADEARLNAEAGAAAAAEAAAKAAYNELDKALIDAQLSYEKSKNQHYFAMAKARNAYERRARFAQEHAAELEAADKRFATVGR